MITRARYRMEVAVSGGNPARDSGVLRHRLTTQSLAPAGIGPDRVKFLRTVRIIRRRAADPASPPDRQKRSLAAVIADITSPCNLNPARRLRSYPCGVR